MLDPSTQPSVRHSPEPRSESRPAARSTTFSIRQLRSWYRKRLPVVYPEHVPRPRARIDCLTGPRPCPWVSCRYNLYLDVKSNGSVRLNFPDLEPHEMRVSCALDVAHQGGLDVTHAARFLNISRERLRQIEAELMAKLRDAAAEGDRSMARALLELWGDE